MPSILIPSESPNPSSLKQEGPLPLGPDYDAATTILAPHALIQLEDELERSRMREAFWMSVVVHLMVVILLVLSPKIFRMGGVVLTTPADYLRNQQVTYIDLPPDLQKAPKIPPKTDVISDKNRIAESRHPSLDKKTLEELKRAGPPGMSAPPSESQQAAQQPSPQGAQQQPNPSQGQQMAQLTPVPDPRLPTPSQSGGSVPNFAQMMKAPGDLTQQAAMAAAARHSSGGSFGGGGAYGAGPGGSARVQGNLEVLSDTQGVDFGPYLSRLLQAVRMNWYNLIPEEARAPLMKRGKVSIQFVVLPDGQIAGLTYVGPSGDVALDRAAWGGITASVPFAPLPKEFHGPYLALRFHFYYNPQKGDLE